MTNKITDVYFDLDHTLWDFERNSALAMETILKEHDIDVNLKDFLSIYVPINLRYWDWYRNEKITQAELRIGRLKETFTSLNYVISDDKILLLSDEYVYYLPTFNYLYDGAIEILEYLKPKYKLHIITNGFQNVQDGKMRNSGIERYFETITNSEMAGAKKPSPKIFEFALGLRNVKKQNAIMIGDCMDADVGGAIRFGIDAILFNEHFIEISETVKQINHLLELKKIL